MTRTPEAICKDFVDGKSILWAAATGLIYSLREHPIAEVMMLPNREITAYFREYLYHLASLEEEELQWIGCPKPHVTLEEVRSFAEYLRRWEQTV